MAGVLNGRAVERRSEARRSPRDSPWCETAVLRPGQEVQVINLSSRGALLECGRALRPGMRADLQLVGSGARRVLRARVLRCAVAGLDPIRYRGALAFEDGLAFDAAGPVAG